MAMMDGTTFGVGMPRPAPLEPIACFSHLRWDFVFQRPQQLTSRFAKSRPVYFFEEPVDHHEMSLDRRVCPETGVTIVTPRLPIPRGVRELRFLLDKLLHEIGPAIA